tara:strand:- start:345 stop:554 length:210 start_codon:yes stop_codon:yes gene_type:complete
MKEIILKVLSEVACKNTGSCQINLQSESARIMITEKLYNELHPYVNDLIEDVIVGINFEIEEKLDKDYE